MPLYTQFLPDHYKKFQVSSVYDTNVQYRIWCFCCNLFLNYPDNRHTDQALKMWFLSSGDLITCKFIKNSIPKIWPQNNTFCTITWIRERKKWTRNVKFGQNFHCKMINWILCYFSFRNNLSMRNNWTFLKNPEIFFWNDLIK